MNQTNNFETPMQLQQLWTITYNEHHFKLWINETATLNSNESNKLYWNTNELVTSINKIMTSNSQWINVHLKQNAYSITLKTKWNSKFDTAMNQTILKHQWIRL